MSKKTSQPEFDLKLKVQDKIKSDVENRATASELVKVNTHVMKKDGNTGKLTEIMKYDIYEIMTYAILGGQMQRRDVLHYVGEYLDQCGFELDPEGSPHDKSVSTNYLLQMYEKSRKMIFERSLQNIEEERDSYINAMHRLAAKAEIDRDYNAAGKCLSEIAKIGGVFDANDSSNIVLNFKLVEAKKESKE